MDRRHYCPPVTARGLRVSGMLWTQGEIRMPFDMTAGKKRESISHPEEAILVLCYQDGGSEEFPELSLLWEEFYDGPRIDPDRALRIAKELRSATPSIKESLDSALTDSALRLARFFQEA